MPAGGQLTEAQHVALDKWWAEHGLGADHRSRVAEFHAAGFKVAFSCISWRELRAGLPDMAEVMGRSIMVRHRVRA